MDIRINGFMLRYIIQKWINSTFGHLGTFKVLSNLGRFYEFKLISFTIGESIYINLKAERQMLNLYIIMKYLSR